jgi:hypothetical protein
MLLIQIYNDISEKQLTFDKILDIFFIYDSYCLKYNFKLIFIDDLLNKFISNITENLDNLIEYQSNDLLINIHKSFSYLGNLDKNYIIKLNLKQNIIIHDLLLNYITENEIRYNIKSYYNILIKHNFIYFNYEYICIDLNFGDILLDTKNYISINKFKDQYDELIEKYHINTKLIKTILITYNHNYINYDIFKNYIVLNSYNYNSIELFYIMFNSKYFIKSNNHLTDYINLFNL